MRDKKLSNRDDDEPVDGRPSALDSIEQRTLADIRNALEEIRLGKTRPAEEVMEAIRKARKIPRR